MTSPFEVYLGFWSDTLEKLSQPPPSGKKLDTPPPPKSPPELKPLPGPKCYWCDDRIPPARVDLHMHTCEKNPLVREILRLSKRVVVLEAAAALSADTLLIALNKKKES